MSLAHAIYGGSTVKRVKPTWTLSQRLICRAYRVPRSSCLLLPVYKNHRYAYVKWKGKDLLAHRAMWVVMKGKIPKGLCVCHTCDTPACINIEHLFLGTHLENMRDRDAKGRRVAPVGLDHHQHKLTPTKVRAIRKSKMRMAVLAKKYGVNRGTIHDVINRKTWVHI